MANKDFKANQPGGAPIGSRQGGAPAGNATANDIGDRAAVHKTRTERAALIENPNENQAGNWAGSNDNTSGSQTGADIDPIPDLPDR
jgi:hypothetical protein